MRPRLPSHCPSPRRGPRRRGRAARAAAALLFAAALPAAAAPRAAAPLKAATPATPAAAAAVVALTGATVHTMGPAGTIAGATVLIENGRIRAVGKDLAVPAGARRIDAGGKVITPGLFDSFTTLGLVEVNAVVETRDAAAQDDRLSAAIDVADALNPRSMLIPINRVEGITRAVSAPEVGKSPLAGMAAVIQLGGGPELVVRRQAALFVYLGAIGKDLAGKSRADAMLRLREALEDALDFAAHRPAWEKAGRRSYALSRLDLQALTPVVRGERPLVAAVNRASDIQAVLRLARDYRLRLILLGAEEGWLVAGEIAAAHVPVLLNPLADLPQTFEQLGATLENAARLHRAGVTLAFVTGDAHNSRNLKQGAGNAVTYGLPWEAALAAMTVNPARIWGIADRYGTLAPGMDADLVVWDGDPLEVTTFADRVFIRGVEMPRDTRQTRLRDRYLNRSGELPPAYPRP
jgi:imidazolonepropionase-like amidohydrolase